MQKYLRASDKDLPVMQKPSQSKSANQSSSLSKELVKNLKLIAANDTVLEDSAQQFGQKKPKTSQNVIPVFFKFQDIKFTKFLSLADDKVKYDKDLLRYGRNTRPDLILGSFPLGAKRGNPDEISGAFFGP